MEQAIVPQITPWTVGHIHEHLDQVDLCPPYQRDVVWDTYQQVVYLNSLCLGRAPTVVILNRRDQHNWVCIDGKQRLTAVWQFMNNQTYTVLHGQVVWYSQVGQPLDCHANWPQRAMCWKERHLFRMTNLHVSCYYDLSYNDQVDIFNRIHHGVRMGEHQLLYCTTAVQTGLDDIIDNHRQNLASIMTKNSRDQIYGMLTKVMYNAHVRPCNNSKHVREWLQDNAHRTDCLTHLVEHFVPHVVVDKRNDMRSPRVIAIMTEAYLNGPVGDPASVLRRFISAVKNERAHDNDVDATSDRAMAKLRRIARHSIVSDT